MEYEGQKPVSTTLTSFEVLEHLHRLDGGTTTEIANETGIAKSTAHRHLLTMRDAGWLVKEGNQFHLSLRFLELGNHAQTRKAAFEFVKPKVSQVADETGERCQFIIEENGFGVYLHTALGEHAVRTDSGEGKRVPLNTISAGKAILANLDEERVREIIETHGLPQATPNTITDEEALFEELLEIRDLGYAINHGESTEGLRAVSVPVIEPDDGVIGALGVSGPAHRLSYDRVEEEIVDLLLGVVNEIELDIKYS